MKIWDLLVGARPFVEYEEIIAEACRQKSPNCNPEKASSLLIFNTSSQRSWLVCLPDILVFVLDDLNVGMPEAKRSWSKNTLITDGRIGFTLETSDYSKKTGRIKLPGMKNGFLFSKALFLDSSIEDKVYNLIKKQMIRES